jgi:hypothetical protein
VAQRYGAEDAFAGFSEEDIDRVNDIYDAAEDALKKDSQRKASAAAAADYARMKGGADVPGPSAMVDPPADNDGGVDEEPAPAPEPAPPPRDELADVLALVSDVAPPPGEHYEIWLSIVKRLAAQPTQRGVMEEYARCEEEGLIAKLPQMVATNSRTVRFRIKKMRPE